MIVVIADDFTGAAELAGVGLTHGLRVKIELNEIEPEEADLLVIATDTRSKDRDSAIREISDLTERLGEIRPSLIYKKIDSVLRGHILAETQTMVNSLDVKGAIVVPANPILGRIIVDGVYYINGKLLEETSFSVDPDFRIDTSSVIEILKRDPMDTDLRISRPEGFSGEGTIIVGEAATANDLNFWAGQSQPDWLPCGAAGFFQALLNSLGKPLVNGNNGEGLPGESSRLFLCGSTFQGSRNLVTDAARRGPHVSYMPSAVLYRHPNYREVFTAWVNEVSDLIRKYGKAIVAVSDPVISDPSVSAWIRSCSASLVKEVFEQVSIDELLVEGGSTASAVISKMEFTRFVPLHQFQQGVIRMKVENREGLNMTLKPGSYTWPESIWNF